MQLKLVRSWIVSTRSMLRCHTVARQLAEFKEPECGFEDSPRTSRSFTITTDENIEAVEQIVMRDHQISVCRVAHKLAIPIVTVCEIMSNHLSMKKVSTRWVPKLFTPIQRTNHVNFGREVLQESAVNPDNNFHRIVTGRRDMGILLRFPQATKRQNLEETR